VEVSFSSKVLVVFADHQGSEFYSIVRERAGKFYKLADHTFFYLKPDIQERGGWELMY
jgi:hypothetical protein